MVDLIIPVLAGGLGGFIHDIAKNKGIITLPKRINNELYLGSLLGILLGAVCGLLAIPTAGAGTEKVASVAFFSGIGFKGLGEAITTAKPR
jgi:hypothetical protein